MHLPEQFKNQNPNLTVPVIQPMDHRDANQHFECVLALIVMASLTVMVTFERICALAICTEGPVSKSTDSGNTADDNIDNTEHGPRQTRSPSLSPSPALDLNPRETDVNSSRSMDDNENELFRTRVVRRGLLLWFGYTTFQTGEDYRDVETDFEMLNKVFTDIDFTVLSHWDLSKQETVEKMKGISLEGYDCVFVVVSSHGYGREGLWDTEIRCSGGGLVSTYDIVEYFNRLPGVPKVFIFQACRGRKMLPRPTSADTDRVSVGDDDEPRAAGPRKQTCYSDILIAYSTLPGFVSPRNMAGERGSWYMQALCEVFAAHAHRHHVLDLFRLLDDALQHRCSSFKPVYENWSFKSNLYLYQAQNQNCRNLTL